VDAPVTEFIPTVIEARPVFPFQRPAWRVTGRYSTCTVPRTAAGPAVGIEPLNRVL